MKVLFLDRDGVINRDAGYISQYDDFEFILDNLKGLNFFTNLGFELIIITNQSGIGRGYFSEEEYQLLTKKYLKDLNRRNINILDVFHCPHLPQDSCDCRKPKDGMIQKAKVKYNINLENSILIGDKISDVQAGKKAGLLKCFLIEGKEARYVNKEVKVYSNILEISNHYNELI